VALLSPEQSASIVWNDDSDTESVDMDARDTDRLFTFEVAKRNEQEDSAIARPGFQVPCSVPYKSPLLIDERCIHATSRVLSHHLTAWSIPQPSDLTFYQGRPRRVSSRLLIIPPV
jgi:hypothetical protein